MRKRAGKRAVSELKIPVHLKHYKQIVEKCRQIIGKRKEKVSAKT